MIVQNDGDYIRISDEFTFHLLTRDEAFELLDEITECIKMCPVSIPPNEPGQPRRKET